MTAVSLGKTSLSGMAAGNHWAVKVGEQWYEYLGTTTALRSKCQVRFGKGKASCEGAGVHGRTYLVGTTHKGDLEIGAFVREYEQRNPEYCGISINCQKFAVEFIEWLTDSNCDIIVMQSAGFGVHLNGGTSFAASNGEEMRATWRLGHAAAEGTIVSARAEGPGFNAQAGQGAFVDVEACRVEGTIGGVVGAAFCPNVSTGAGFRNGNAEARLLGGGISVGQDGLKLSTPLFEVKLDPFSWLLGGASNSGASHSSRASVSN